MTDPAEPRMSELVNAARQELHRARLRRRPLGGDDDREVARMGMPALDQPADLVDVERDLGDQDHVGAAGDPRVQRDPACAAAHHLHDQDPVVALGGGVQAVDRLGRDLQRGVEAERHVGRPEIVVDRLWHSDDVDAALMQLVGDAERVLAANRNQPVELEACKRLTDEVHAIVALVGVRARAAKDRAAAGEDPARGLDVELGERVLEHPPPAVAEADQMVAVAVDPLPNDRPDDRVEAGAIAAACE